LLREWIAATGDEEGKTLGFQKINEEMSALQLGVFREEAEPCMQPAKTRLQLIKALRQIISQCNSIKIKVRYQVVIIQSCWSSSV
jgi:hypothetical protein